MSMNRKIAYINLTTQEKLKLKIFQKKSGVCI